MKTFEEIVRERDDFRCRFEKSERETTRLREALSWCSGQVWEGYGIDGGDFQDHMESTGLLVLVPADEEFREQWDSDTMYAWHWSDLAKANQQQEKR